MDSIAGIRKDYKLEAMSEDDVAADPFVQFGYWWTQAINSQVDEVNAMTLATADKAGNPSARIVLLKGVDEKGFIFFTNYNSHKGHDLAENPRAALVFFWKELERQVRVEGVVSKTSEAESDAYFMSRPEGSKLGAWASPQSSIISSREVIEKNVTELQQQFAGREIGRPPHWGGYIVQPSLVEFWQGRQSRLHDRIRYTVVNGEWKIERLAP